MRASILAGTLLAAVLLPAVVLAQPGDADDLAAMQEQARRGDGDAQARLGKLLMDGDTPGVARNEREAVAWLRRAAEQGDVGSQARLGDAYRLGRGVAGNPALALKWYRLAAMGGDAGALTHLAEAYAKGVGVPADPVLAQRFLALAAADGDAGAQRELATRSLQGNPTPARLQEGRRYLEGAADGGDVRSQLQLAQLLELGRGGPQDLPGAYYWYGRASMAGNNVEKALQALAKRIKPADLSQAQLKLAEACRPDRGGKPSYDASGRPGELSPAVKWTMLAAENGDAELKFKIAIKFWNGYEGFPKDPVKAERFYRGAAEGGNLGAQQVYGIMLLGEKKTDEGLRYLRLAAARGNHDCQQYLATCFLNGQWDVPLNVVEGIKWTRELANHGDANAMDSLGRFYATGHGVPLDKEIALRWYIKAAEAGEGERENALAGWYERGVIGPADPMAAYLWYAVSLENHYPCSAKPLARLAASFTPEQLAKAKQQVADWWKAHPNSHSHSVYGVNCP